MKSDPKEYRSGWSPFHRFVYLIVLLVISLRVWGDLTRPDLSLNTPTYQALFRHTPPDDFRYVFNFPASWLSSLVVPPPVHKRGAGWSGFVLLECLSLSLEVCLTLAFWLGTGKLVRSMRLSHLTRVPLRAVLPAYFLLWSIYLSHVGYLQSKVVHFDFGDPFGAATHLFAGLAVNAPASFGSGALFNLFSTGDLSWPTWWDDNIDFLSHFAIGFHNLREAPWGYCGAVFLMWFLIGGRIDQWRRGENTEERYRLTWWNRIIWSLCGMYGVWLLYEAMGSFNGEYALWFSVVGMLWSAVTVGGSLYVLERDGRLRRGISIGVICLVLGLATVGLAAVLKAKLDLDIDYVNGLVPNLNADPSHDLWRTLSIALWGLALFLEGCYFLWHWKERPASTP
jgi:hypothetical protein